MDDLIAWLRAQLDDDERVAREAAGAPWSTGIGGMVHVDASAIAENRAWRTLGYVASVERDGDREHIARWDPARVLAEVDAKRRILDAWETWTREQRESWADYSDWAEGKAVGEAPQRTISDNAGKGLEIAIKILTLPLAGREGYRDEWRP